MTKCTFHKFGASGTVETKDGLCILPLNIINEKIYVFLWLWFIFLAVVTGIFVSRKRSKEDFYNYYEPPPSLRWSTDWLYW